VTSASCALKGRHSHDDELVRFQSDAEGEPEPDRSGPADSGPPMRRRICWIEVDEEPKRGRRRGQSLWAPYRIVVVGTTDIPRPRRTSGF
jgi:hypothetical protein